MFPTWKDQIEYLEKVTSADKRRWGMSVPGTGLTVTVGVVPSGASAQPPPSLTSTVTVNVCCWPTAFVAVPAIEMRAST